MKPVDLPGFSRNNFQIRVWCHIIIALLISYSFDTAHAAQRGEKKDETRGLTVQGADPKAFVDAKDMFKGGTGPSPPADTAKVLTDLATAIRNNENPDNPQSGAVKILHSLAGLSPKDYETLRGVAHDYAAKLRGSKAAATSTVNTMFEQANQAYERGAFSEAATKYAQVLQAQPDHPDARNNLALAELHQGRNVAAAFHVLVLEKLKPSYGGARINLSVALERLGLSEDAYRAARAVSTSLPMGQYNLAWFENMRGNYDAAARNLGMALQTLPDYAKAKNLSVVNDLESGKKPIYPTLQALPPPERSRIERLKLERFTVPPAGADLFDRGEVRGKAQAGKVFTVSAKEGGWIAVYWSAAGNKHRYWVKADTTNASATPAPSAPASGDLAGFVGTWGEKWAEMNIPASITITQVDGKPQVTLKAGWRVWDAKFENGVLSFRKKGGGSNWEFLYKIERGEGGKPKLTVFREHDQRTYHGELFR